MHLTAEAVVGNNDLKKLELELPADDATTDYTEFFRYDLWEELISGTTVPLCSKNPVTSEMDCQDISGWDPAKKAPPAMACFKLKANRGSAGSSVRVQEYFCVHATDLEGNMPVQSPEEAHMIAEEWVNSISRFGHKKALAQTTEALAKLPEDL